MALPLLGSILKGAIEFRSILPIDNLKTTDPYKAQRNALRKLLRKAQISAFGEKYEFARLLRSNNIISDFQKTVPTNDYNSMHNNWWFRTLLGEPFVSWPGHVKYFALSSGTSGASSKYIPVTPDMLRAIQRTSIRQILTLSKYNFPPEFFEKGILMLGGSTQLEFNGTYYEGDLSGITTGNIPFWFQHFYKPGTRISKERNWTTKLEEIVKNAPNWDIGVIVGVPAWLQILLEKIIETYKLKTIHDIWPNLSIYVHGGVSFTPYIKSFEKLLSRPLTYIETYLASEGFIAYQTRPDTNSMQLVLDNGLFYEFVPFTSENFDDEGNMRPKVNALSIKDVEEGVDYALLISTCAGAWRYLIGDTIRFTSKTLSEIIITGRTKHFMSLCGEHLSLENLNNAIEMLENQTGLSIREFTLSGIKEDKMFAHKWYLGTDLKIDPIDIAKKLDDNLKILNDDYRTERLHAIQNVYVEPLPLNVFYDYMRKQGKEGGQNKFPRVIKGNKLKEWEDYLKDSIK